MAYSTAVRIAVVEIGTNSAKFLIARTKRSGGFAVEHFSKQTTRIGRGIARRGQLDADGIEQTVAAVERFARLTRQLGCSHEIAFTTFALRRAGVRNTAAVVRRIERAFGHPLRILSGRDEAFYAYASARHSLELRKATTVIIDVGGGSTEIVWGHRDRLVAARSIRLGALHLTERFVHGDPIRGVEFERLIRHIRHRVASTLDAMGIAGKNPATFELVASGGSASTLSRVLARMSGGRGTASTRARVPGASSRALNRGVPSVDLGSARVFLKRCAAMTVAERRRIPGLEADRADIICAGLAIVIEFMRGTRKRVLRVNHGGVREGVLIEFIRNGLRWSR